MGFCRRLLALPFSLSGISSSWRPCRRVRPVVVVLLSALSLLVSSLALGLALPGVAVAAAFDPPGLITTVAGTGVAGFSGDGGPATAAQLYYPKTVAVDGAGGILFTDYINDSRIRRVSPTGVITTIAGNGSAGYSGDGGPAVAAAVGFPAGLAVDKTGNIFIADLYNHRVRRVGTNGIITTIAGTGVGGFSGDGGPLPPPSCGARTISQLTGSVTSTSPSFITIEFGA